MAKAKSLELTELKYPHDANVEGKEFVHSEGELSLKALLLDVAEYNRLISDKHPNQEEKVLEMDPAQFDFSAISITLSELTQIQLQIATNENGYLNHLSNK